MALKKCRKIQTADGSVKMSIGSASLGIQVLSRKEYKARHTEAPFPADASDNPESPASDTDESIQTGDIGGDEPTAEAAGTQEPPDQGITSETGMATGQPDQGMMQGNSSTTEPPAATASALPGDARNTQGFPGLTKGICIVILCLALAGFVMVMILLRSALKPVDDWGEDMEDDSTVESEPEEDIPEETELSMEEIEKRLEEKRRWLRKE